MAQPLTGRGRFLWTPRTAPGPALAPAIPTAGLAGPDRVKDRRMASTCVVGLQWGDEAKGKIVDLLTDQHDFVVRYNGGNNAGHTVVAGDKVFKFSLLPTGILRPNVRAVIGNGVVVYPPRFLEEVKTLRRSGIE